MIILEHDKVYQNPNETVIGNIPELTKTTIKFELDTKNNPIDNIIYVLMAAEAKRTSDNVFENALAETRFDYALDKLKEFMEKEYSNGN